MLAWTLMTAALALAGGNVARGDDTRASYEELKRETPLDAASQVQLALWCERNGLNNERAKHLAMATLADPGNVLPRSLLGLMKVGEEWVRIEDVAQVEANNAAREEYRARRQKAKLTVDAQSKLAAWCESQGLLDEAQAHWRAVVRLDPSREAAWKKLGCRKVNGQWLTEEQFALARADLAEQEAANARWAPQMKGLVEALRGKDPARRAQAHEALLEVRDPRAVPALCRLLINDDPACQALAVRVLAGIDGPGASRSLSGLALLSDDPSVRKQALETLRGRDPREFAAPLIGLLRKPLSYQVVPVAGPGSPGTLFVEGERFNVQFLYSPPAMPEFPISPYAWYELDAEGLPRMVRIGEETTRTFQTYPSFVMTKTLGELRAQVESGRLGDPRLSPDSFDLSRIARETAQSDSRMGRQIYQANPDIYALRMPWFGLVTTQTVREASRDIHHIPIGQVQREYLRSAVASHSQQADDVAIVERINASIHQCNDRVRLILSQVAGVDQGDDPKAWGRWWVDLLGYATHGDVDAPKPTILRPVPLAYVPRPLGQYTNRETTRTILTSESRIVAGRGSRIASCFAAGTPVTTLDGPRLIEDLQVGDLVLAQDPQSGALAYKAVTSTHHNPPSATFQVRMAGGETIVSSTFHRFWVAGRGWVMARELKKGDPIRTLRGVASVESIEDGNVVPVFNLDVADAATFFVGQNALLVHDNTLPDFRARPYDRLDGPFAAAATP